MNIEQLCDQVHQRLPFAVSSMINEKSNSVLFFNDDGAPVAELSQQNGQLCVQLLDPAARDAYYDFGSGKHAHRASNGPESKADTMAIIVWKST